ncbi:Uncharacterized protein APZ42_027150 [Daphnia magna]|uniref:Uncharacterized protein n=1 Tax=Daphnia magna TaxID=35525 RepID=A0A164RB62_9CRUS|nr:Uncharacterized protein APZ42_027150 [Daphnia magna]
MAAAINPQGPAAEALLPPPMLLDNTSYPTNASIVAATRTRAFRSIIS